MHSFLRHKDPWLLMVELSHEQHLWELWLEQAAPCSSHWLFSQIHWPHYIQSSAFLQEEERRVSFRVCWPCALSYRLDVSTDLSSLTVLFPLELLYFCLATLQNIQLLMLDWRHYDFGVRKHVKIGLPAVCQVSQRQTVILMPCGHWSGEQGKLFQCIHIGGVAFFKWWMGHHVYHPEFNISMQRCIYTKIYSWYC